MNSLWISWHKSQRSRSLAKEFDIPIFEYVNETNLFIRHFFSSLWTIYFLVKKRPLIIFLQYSFMLLFVVFLYKNIRRKHVQVICDCHTKAIRRKLTNIFSNLFFIFKKISFKATDICIISNHELIHDINQFSNNYFIVPDPIPNLKYSISSSKTATSYCVYVNSYAVDEPYNEVIEASEKIYGKIKIICTGRIPIELRFLKQQPYKNIYFTDYIQDCEYNNLIANAECILALSMEDSTLLCAGYEALSVNTPLITSDTKALREYFGESVLFTKTTSDDIAKCIMTSLKKSKRIKDKMQILKRLKEHDQKLILAKLLKKIKFPGASPLA